MDKFYEEVEIVYTAKVVRLKERKDDWINVLYGQLDYMLRSDKSLLVGMSKIDVKGKADEHTKED